jgi:hypothetical protein
MDKTPPALRAIICSAFFALRSLFRRITFSWSSFRHTHPPAHRPASCLLYRYMHLPCWGVGGSVGVCCFIGMCVCIVGGREAGSGVLLLYRDVRLSCWGERSSAWRPVCVAGKCVYIVMGRGAAVAVNAVFYKKNAGPCAYAWPRLRC